MSKETREESIKLDLEKIKAAKLCIIDNNAGLFQLPNGEQVEIAGQDVIIALALLLSIPYEWE